MLFPCDVQHRFYGNGIKCFLLFPAILETFFLPTPFNFYILYLSHLSSSCSVFLACSCFENLWGLSCFCFCLCLEGCDVNVEAFTSEDYIVMVSCEGGMLFGAACNIYCTPHLVSTKWLRIEVKFCPSPSRSYHKAVARPQHAIFWCEWCVVDVKVSCHVPWQNCSSTQLVYLETSVAEAATSVSK